MTMLTRQEGHREMEMGMEMEVEIIMVAISGTQARAAAEIYKVFFGVFYICTSLVLRLSNPLKPLCLSMV